MDYQTSETSGGPLLSAATAEDAWSTTNLGTCTTMCSCNQRVEIWQLWFKDGHVIVTFIVRVGLPRVLHIFGQGHCTSSDQVVNTCKGVTLRYIGTDVISYVTCDWNEGYGTIAGSTDNLRLHPCYGTSTLRPSHTDLQLSCYCLVEL